MARKTFIVIILVLVVALGLTAFGWKKSYVAKIMPATLSTKVGWAAPMTVATQNLSASPLRVRHIMEVQDWVSVTDEKGQPAALSDVAKSVKDAVGKDFTIGPNETRDLTFDLAKTFVLPAGTYTITPKPQVTAGAVPAFIDRLFWLRGDVSPAKLTVTEK